MTSTSIQKGSPHPVIIPLPFDQQITFTKVIEGTWTKLHAKFGKGLKGIPSEGEIGWSQPDAFKTRYTEAQIAESYPQEDTDKFPSFTDTDGKIYSARYMPCDGYTISGEVMASIARADIARAESWSTNSKTPIDPA
tara:strand:+ start:1479 stop:1889 length:411 start_codon:yes stop_codon:yes gene_type:complete